MNLGSSMPSGVDSPFVRGSRLRRKLLRPVLGTLLCLFLLGGCKSMTDTMAEKKERERTAEAEAEKQKSEAEARNKAIEAKNKEIERKNREIERKVVRETLKFEAIQALQDGQAALALEKIEQVYDPPPETRKEEGMDTDIIDPQTGKPQLFAVEKPTMDAEEESRLEYVKGMILFQLERKKEAHESFEKALRIDPEFRQARRDYGKVLYQDSEYKKALEVWQKELSDGHRDTDLLYLVAQARYEVGRQEKNISEWEAARLLFQNVLMERPRDLEVQRWLAILEFETGRYEESIRLFESILKQKPLDPEYLELLANAYIKLDDYKKAIDYLELASRVKPPTPAMCKTLGDLYASQALPSRAAEWHLRSFGGDPKKASADERLNVGTLFLDAHDLESAETWLGAIAETDKSYASAQSNLAYVYMELGKYDEAVAAFERVRKVKPQDGAAVLAAADIYLRQKKFDEAAEAYALASGLPEKDVKADGFAGLAEVAYERGDLAAAKRQYEKALGVKPDERFAVALRQISEEAKYRQDSGESAEAKASETASAGAGAGGDPAVK